MQARWHRCCTRCSSWRTWGRMRSSTATPCSSTTRQGGGLSLLAVARARCAAGALAGLCSQADAGARLPTELTGPAAPAGLGQLALANGAALCNTTTRGKPAGGGMFAGGPRGRSRARRGRWRERLAPLLHAGRCGPGGGPAAEVAQRDGRGRARLWPSGAGEPVLAQTNGLEALLWSVGVGSCCCCCQHAAKRAGGWA